MRTIVALLAFLAPSAVMCQSLERGPPSCDSEAVGRAREGADRGEAASLYLMARHYSTGKCIPGDGPKALDSYWKAAALRTTRRRSITWVWWLREANKTTKRLN